MLRYFTLLFFLLALAVVQAADQPNPATAATAARNETVYSRLDFSDAQEFDFARRGRLAGPEALELKDAAGRLVWSQNAFDFVENTDAPASANPSLWRHTQLNHIHGLFEVMDGIYQVRGYDLSNITFIRGERGWIVFDPLSTVETARAALRLVNDTLGERPVTGVVISHSHVDHFGGIKGVLSAADVASGNIPIIVPAGFEEHAVSENVYAGNAMARRADYMYGKYLQPGERGRLAVGLGVGVPDGTTSYLPPNDHITRTGERRVVDGVTMEFQMTPGTEAPAEMNTWFPEKKAFWAAENCTGTLHNLYTLRGAQVRDGNAWARYLMETVTLYADAAEVVFQSHNWPHWGKDVIRDYLLNTAAAYKFIHDQTLFHLNQGLTPNEISAVLRLPPELDKVWYTRQYYGTVSHDAKAVYQRYMGWYDANPAHLNPLPPAESAKKTVQYMGGRESILEKARADYAAGEYQWVADVTMQLVFADPADSEARELCADAFEQLGYQAESGVWRAVYLTGAKELREGGPKPGSPAPAAGDLRMAMDARMVFDTMGISLDTTAVEDVNMTLNVTVTDDAEYLLTLRHGVLLYQKNARAEKPDVRITVPRSAVALLLSPEGVKSGEVAVEGDVERMLSLYQHMQRFDRHFNIIEP